MRFNSRTPCGVRRSVSPVLGSVNKFQFTHPVRGATTLQQGFHLCIMFQFTHPVRGATPTTLETLADVAVSIHAPRAGCDELTEHIEVFTEMFQFTHPVRGATQTKQENKTMTQVSIHAPRAGCDT